jgi:hypothetical protein
MILDGLLTFTGTSNGASGGISSGAQTDKPTTGTQVASNVLDLGVTSGVPTDANGGGARDIGIGDDPGLKLSVIMTAGLTTGCTLQLELSGAPDSSGSPGSYTIMWTSAAFTAAQCVAGAQLANIDVPRTIAGQVLPRYLNLTFITTSTNTTGLVEAQIVLDLDQQVPAGGGAYISGYPAGVTVAN